jgi:hypothetical protein
MWPNPIFWPRHNPRRRSKRRPHLNHIFRRWHQRFARKMLRAISVVRVHPRRASIPTDFWFHYRRRRDFADSRFGDPKRWGGRAPKCGIWHRRNQFADWLSIFPNYSRCRRRFCFRIWQRTDRWFLARALNRLRLRILILSFARSREGPREIFWETIGFAWDQGHGRQSELNLLTIPIFPVNPNIAVVQMSFSSAGATLSQ